MRRRRRGFAVVVDEYGGFAGVITINDLVSELVGDLRDEFDRTTSPSILRIDARRYLVDGACAVDEVVAQTRRRDPRGGLRHARRLLVRRARPHPGRVRCLRARRGGRSASRGWRSGASPRSSSRHHRLRSPQETAQAGLPTGSSAAWLARSVRDAEVAGSNPAFPTLYRQGGRPDDPRASGPSRSPAMNEHVYVATSGERRDRLEPAGGCR